MELALEDKVVWVTGASGGIGRAVAQAAAAEGARVAVHGHRSADAARAWLAEQPWHERGMVVQADVRSAAELDACADAIHERWGRIDACVANAGIWPPGDLLLDELPEERLRDTIAVNLIGALLTARSFMRTLRATGPRADGHGAALVFTGSTAGRFGERGHVDYAASKAGLLGAVRTLKNEIVRLDPWGRVNLVEPGWTVTHMARPAIDDPEIVERVVRTMALRQMGRAEDVARTITWLLSPAAAAHVSGQTITVAGGMEGRLLWEADEVEHRSILARLERD